MAAFKYKAIDAAGKEIKGIIEADNEKHLRQQLGQQSLWLVEAKISDNTRSTQSKKTTGFSINSNDLVLLTQQLAVLLESGLPLAEALDITATQTEKSNVEWLLRDIKSRVSEGQSFENALSAHNKTFQPLYIALVAAGEATGNLSAILQQLAEYTERRQAIKASLTKALIYPAILGVTATAIIIVLMTTVFPRIVSQFDYMQSALPRPTQILMTISDVIRHDAHWIIIPIIGMWGGCWFLLRKDDIRLAWHRRKLKITFWGKLFRQLNAARFADTLAICSFSGVPLIDGIQVAARATTNEHIQKQLYKVAENVQGGESLFSALEKRSIVDAMMLYMIGSGEKSGKLPEMLKKAANYQQTALDNRIDLAVKLFTPLMMLILAGLVFFIIIATLLPILALNNLV
ncbi:MAG: type II secretion system inner membrane protein GspF [Gammaproteobacteria bacterium]|nr:type II secretion system inner membrane protein GspF [Gammaproteobacteria bacterium]